MNKKRGGVNLNLINICSVAIAVLLSGLMIFYMVKSISVFNDMNAATEKYISLQSDIALFKAGSDYLTEQVRLFTVTGRREYMDNYFEELNRTKRRDEAIADVGKYISDKTEEYGYFKLARDLSDELVELEYYAMRLALEGYGYSQTDYPDELVLFELSAADKAISAEGKRDTAINTVFSRDYQKYKGKIYYNTEKCFEIIEKDNREALDGNRERLSAIIKVQSVIVVLLFFTVVFVVFMTVTLILNPLKRGVKMINEGKDISENGSEEMRSFAQSYNRASEYNAKKNDQLSYEATHDALTGLYNRASFIKQNDREDWNDVAVIALDIDKFKDINDTNGHTSGDLALKRFSDVLRSTFRAEDYIARIGGDEFIIVMLNSGPEHVPLIKNKIETAQEILKTPDTDVPAIFFSAGVAFGRWCDGSDVICENADQALYRVKKNGRNGYAFF